MTSTDFATVGPTQLKSWLRDGSELALIDVRDQGVFFDRHLLFACCLPLSRLELLARQQIPRLNTRIVVCDGGDEKAGPALPALSRLAGLGYSELNLLAGGVAGWAAAGYELFSGINVPSKAFGEYVEHRYDTPRVTAEELHARQAAGERLVILDSRPMAEFTNMSIPGGVDCPGAELVYRVFESAPDPDTPVIVNCAGRTRSIIGAQSLINAAIPNPVAALKDGTMGWTLAGFEVAKGHTEHAPEPSPAALEKSRRAAAAVAERFGVRGIDHAELDRLGAQADVRTLYLIDVRTPEEYRLGHLPDSRSAPGGQLVQATDEYLPVRNARVVLIDDREVRANMTGSWLRQMGWDDVFVLRQPFVDRTLTGGDGPAVALTAEPASTLTVGELSRALDGSTPPAVLDLATSLQHRRGHIPGAWWGVRTRPEEALAAVEQTGADRLVLTAPAGEQVLLHFTAAELAALRPGLSVEVLDGGTDAWVAAGLPLADGAERLASEPNDVWYKPYQHRQAVQQAMQDYLTWEVNLVEQIERDGDARFR